MMDVTIFAHISRSKSSPLILSNSVGIILNIMFPCPSIMFANNTASELITILTTNFGFLGELASKRVMASKRPEIPIDINGNEYAQNAVPLLSSSQTKPLVCQIDTMDSNGKITKTVKPKSASL